MNIIEAWKQAKVGQTIKEKYGYEWTKKNDFVSVDLQAALQYSIASDCASSDNWEVVKKNKTVVGFVESVGMAERYVVVFPLLSLIPMGAKITAEWEE